MKTHVLHSKTLAVLLNAMPEMKDAVSLFDQRRYGVCLSTLARLHPHFSLSPCYASVLPALFRRIHEQCIVAYVQPYAVVELETMAADFAQSRAFVESQVTTLVLRGTLTGTIDRQHHV